MKAIVHSGGSLAEEVYPASAAIAEGATTPTSTSGDIRWSTTTGALMQWDGSNWRTIKTLPVPVTSQAGTSYTTVLADAGSLILFTATTAITVTIPTNASVAYPIGTQISFAQDNTGQLTISNGSVTFRTSLTTKTRARYSVITATKVATDTWYITGDLAIT